MIAAVLWALVAFVWTPSFPGWAIVFLSISISVIWALTAHGGDIAET